MIGKKIKPGFLLKEGRKGKFMQGTMKRYGEKKGSVELVIKKRRK